MCNCPKWYQLGYATETEWMIDEMKRREELGKREDEPTLFEEFCRWLFS